MSNTDRAQTAFVALIDNGMSLLAAGEARHWPDSHARGAVQMVVKTPLLTRRESCGQHMCAKRIDVQLPHSSGALGTAKGEPICRRMGGVTGRRRPSSLGLR